MRRGEIWWADLPEPTGSEPGFRRPILIVQANAFNRSAINTVVCVAITSNLRLVGAPGNVRVSARESGLPRASVVNVSHLLTIDTAFLTECVQVLDLRVMQDIDEGLRLVLSL